MTARSIDFVPKQNAHLKKQMESLTSEQCASLMQKMEDLKFDDPAELYKAGVLNVMTEVWCIPIREDTGACVIASIEHPRGECVLIHEISQQNFLSARKSADKLVANHLGLGPTYVWEKMYD